MQGKVSDELLTDLWQNVPLQEKGRYNEKVLTISRANKSVRLFGHIIGALSSGKQPNITMLEKVGYILRTTAVYGNGKFGMLDYDGLQDNEDFNIPFLTQMCVVYILRSFSIDWINFLAKQKNPEKAVKLNDTLSRFLGVGNATGLGMTLFLLRHPKIVDNWLYQRECALNEIMAKVPSSKHIAKMLPLLDRASKHLKTVVTIDEKQKKLNRIASKEIQDAIQHIQSIVKDDNIWKNIIRSNKKLSYEAQESFLSCLLEIYPEVVEPYEQKMNSDENELTLDNVTIADLLHIIKAKYQWAINIDFKKPDANFYFWYISEEKEEPRLGLRNRDDGAEKELPLDVARQAWHLYAAIKGLDPCMLLSEFLLMHPQFSSITRRIYTMSACPFGEIQTNILDKNFFPMYLLRGKLSFLGATKFDPRSDKWVQVTFFQNAPLIDELDRDDWLFPLLDKEDVTTKPIDRKRISLNEIYTISSKAFLALKSEVGEAENIAKCLMNMHKIDFDGISLFIEASKKLPKRLSSRQIKFQEDRVVVDLQNQSLLYFAPMIIDYALSQVTLNKEFRIIFKHCAHEWSLIGFLMSMSLENVYTMTKWNEDNRCVCAIFSPDNPWANITTCASSDSNNELTMLLSSKSLSHKKKHHALYSSRELQNRASRSIKKGVMIEGDTLKKFTSLYKGLLVEATIDSRKGAGA